MTKRFILDRFEDGFAVLYGGDGTSSFTVPKFLMPNGAREGATIVQDDSGAFSIDTLDTNARRDRIARKMDDLFS